MNWGSRDWRIRPSRSRGVSAAASSAPALTAVAAFVARLDPAQVVGLELPAVRLADLDAVELQRAAHEEAVADVPGVFAALTPDRHTARPAQVNLFALVEDVLLQLLPVVVAMNEHVAHERVEVGLRGRNGAPGRHDQDG